MTGYRLTPSNQIDDYGQERMWKMSKQAPRKRKSQIVSSVEVCKLLFNVVKTKLDRFVRLVQLGTGGLFNLVHIKIPKS